MKEAIFIIIVLLVLLALAAIRYRRQLVMMLNMWRTLKKMRQQMKNGTSQMNTSERASGPLVNCAKCGTWVPENRAIKLGKHQFYCSSLCVEKTVELN